MHYYCSNFFGSVWLCQFCVVICFYHPRHNGQWPPNSKDFHRRCYPLLPLVANTGLLAFGSLPFSNKMVRNLEIDLSYVLMMENFIVETYLENPSLDAIVLRVRLYVCFCSTKKVPWHRPRSYFRTNWSDNLELDLSYLIMIQHFIGINHLERLGLGAILLRSMTLCIYYLFLYDVYLKRIISFLNAI